MAFTNIYELETIYDNRNSFYHKATVLISKGKKTLFSYNTKVAEVSEKNVTLFADAVCSQTTLRHVKEFLKQEGFKAENKKQILTDYKMI